MKAAVATAPGEIEIQERPMPSDPAPGSMVVRPELVGVCGSDLHLFQGDLGPSHDGLLPLVMGHEFSALIEAPDPQHPDLEQGQRITVWPVSSCNQCHTCRQGRPNVCERMSLIGVHQDGALQEYLTVNTANVFSVGDLSGQLAALVEPVSVAIHAVERLRIRAGETLTIFGAGPIGFATAIAARSRGAHVTIVDPVEQRLGMVAADGFETASPDAVADDNGRHLRHDAIMDTTGHPAVLQTAVDAVAVGGRIGVVGLTGSSAPLCSGDLSIKELDVIGVSCCIGNEFGAAVELVRSYASTFDSFVTSVVDFEQTKQALQPPAPSDYKTMIDLRSLS